MFTTNPFAGRSASILPSSMTDEKLRPRRLELLGMLREHMDNIGAEDPHQQQRAWELKHHRIASEFVTHHTLLRKETRWPGDYFRGDCMKPDDDDWHSLTPSRFHRDTGESELQKAPVHHIVD
jgi:adenylylsulfate reductase subunit A